MLVPVRVIKIRHRMGRSGVGATESCRAAARLYCWMSGRATARYKTRTKTATAKTTAVGPSPKLSPAESPRLADVVGEGRTEGPRQDIRHPESGDAVQAETPPRQGREQDEDAEEDARSPGSPG